MVVSSKTDLRFPESGQQGHGARIIQLTQDQVIAKLNLMGISMSKSTYAKLETNRMNIKISELVALAKIFHTDINAFFSGLL